MSRPSTFFVEVTVLEPDVFLEEKAAPVGSGAGVPAWPWMRPCPALDAALTP
jgi:hypothetical protein